MHRADLASGDEVPHRAVRRLRAQVVVGGENPATRRRASHHA